MIKSRILNQKMVMKKMGVKSVTTFHKYFYHNNKPVDDRFPQKRTFGRGLQGWLDTDIDAYLDEAPKVSEE